MKNKKNILQTILNYILKATKFAQHVWDNIFRDSLFILTSGVVYTSLISLIPLITVIAVFLGFFGALQPFLSLMLEKATDLFGANVANTLVTMIEQYSSNAQSLGIIGLVSFIVASLLLINRIWAVFNVIYRSTSYSSIIKRFSTFITILIVGVLLLSLYITLNSMINNWVASALGFSVVTGTWAFIIHHIAITGMTFLSLFLLIKIVPATRARISSSLIGSFIGTILLLIFNNIFTRIINTMVSYSVIYGSMAAVFFLLLWLYSLWLIVFISVEIAYVHEFKPYLNRDNMVAGLPNNVIAEGVNLYLLISHRYFIGEGGTSIRRITETLSINVKQAYKMTDILIANRFLIPVNSKNNVFIPAKPLDKIYVEELVAVIFGMKVLPTQANSVGCDISNLTKDGGLSNIKGTTIEQLVSRM